MSPNGNKVENQTQLLPHRHMPSLERKRFGHSFVPFKRHRGNFYRTMCVRKLKCVCGRGDLCFGGCHGDKG